MGVKVEKMTSYTGEDLSIHHPNEVEEIFIPCKDLEWKKELERKKIEVLKNGFKVIKQVEYIEIEKTFEPDYDWLIFNRHNKEERNELKHSILNNGLFTPVILWQWHKGMYMVISGLERVDIYKELYNEMPEDKKHVYEKIPSFVLELNEIDDVIARIIRIDSNICVRTMDIRSKNRAICEKYMALKKIKATRNEFNIIDTLSESFKLSRTSITNHLTTQKVIEEFLFLFQEGVLSLKSIKKLSKFSKEEQKKILDGIGLEKIKECQINALKEDDVDNPKSLESSIKILKEIKHPYYATLKIKLPRKFAEEAIKLLEMLIKKNAVLQMKLKKLKLS